MAISLVASITATPGSGGGATAAIDTTGATLLVISCAGDLAAGGTFAVSDSKGNTWTTPGSTGSYPVMEQLFYCVGAPTVGTGHTFTVTGVAVLPAILVYAFAGVASVQGLSFGSANGAASPLATGSVTPSMAGALVVTGRAGNGTGVTDAVAPAGFTLATVAAVGGVNRHGSAAYYVQLTAAAIDPTWSWTGSSGANAVQRWVFLPTPGPDPIEGSAVFGVDTTVTATRAIAFGLDGATNVLSDAGTFKVFGDFAVTGDADVGGDLAVTGDLTVGGRMPGHVSSGVFAYTFNTVTTAPPASQRIRFNAGHPYTSVTKVWADFSSADSEDLYWGWMRIHTGSILIVQDKDNHLQFAEFTTTGSPVDLGTYVEVPVMWASNGTALAVQAVLVRVTAPASSVGSSGGAYAPLTTGAEPLEFVSDGAGNLIMVAFTP